MQNPSLSLIFESADLLAIARSDVRRPMHRDPTKATGTSTTNSSSGRGLHSRLEESSRGRSRRADRHELQLAETVVVARIEVE